MTQEKTISSLALELYKAFESKERTDGTQFNCLKDGSPEWMTKVIHAVHGKKLPDDTTYSMIEQCAAAIAELGDYESNEDNARDRVSEIEPDVYTYDLTKWLNARVDHVEYLSEAIKQFGGDLDGYKALAVAQSLQIQEVGQSLISELAALVED
jgi:hypothetical protein